MNLGDYENAIDAFSISIKHNTNNVEALYNRAVCYSKIGNDKLSETDFLRVIDHVKPVNKSKELIGGNDNKKTLIPIMSYVGDYITIDKNFDEGIHNTRLILNELRLKSLIYMAVRKERLGDCLSAIHFYEKALEIKPEDSILLNNLAWIYVKSQKTQCKKTLRAIELAEKAYNLKKEIPILHTLIISYIENGQYGKAKAVFKNAKINGKNFSIHHSIIGDIEARLKGK